MRSLPAIVTVTVALAAAAVQETRAQASAELNLHIDRKGESARLTWRPSAVRAPEGAEAAEARWVTPSYEVQSSRDLIHWKRLGPIHPGGVGRYHSTLEQTVPLSDREDQVYFRLVARMPEIAPAMDRRSSLAGNSSASSIRLQSVPDPKQNQSSTPEDDSPAPEPANERGVVVFISVQDGETVARRRFVLAIPEEGENPGF